MKESLDFQLKSWDWKNQFIGDGKNKKSISSLIAQIENKVYNTKEVEIDLSVIDLSQYAFVTNDLFEFINHYKLIENANLDFPVIVNRRGRIIDGRHRLCKALIEGKDTIKGIMILDADII